MVEHLSYPYLHVPAFNTDQIKKIKKIKKKKKKKKTTKDGHQ